MRFEKINICVGYKHNDETLTNFPSSIEVLENCLPVYEEMDGWEDDLTNLEKISDLPSQARAFLDKIEETTGVPIFLVSLGASREQVMFLKDLFT